MKRIDLEARRCALAMLARGLMRPAEVADLAGVSLQVVRYWCKRAGVDWERIRSRRIADAWRKEMQRGPRLVEEQAKSERGKGEARRKRRLRILGRAADRIEQGRSPGAG